jgi:hypothetical protein
MSRKDFVRKCAQEKFYPAELGGKWDDFSVPAAVLE